nr:tetratricopeptide repeat protein [Niveibacterium sp. COAC-50]
MNGAGLFYDAVGDYQRAIRNFEAAQRMDDAWNINMALAHAYFGAGDYAKSVASYKAAVKKNPNVKNVPAAKDSYIESCKHLKDNPECS